MLHEYTIKLYLNDKQEERLRKIYKATPYMTYATVEKLMEVMGFQATSEEIDMRLETWEAVYRLSSEKGERNPAILYNSLDVKLPDDTVRQWEREMNDE